MSNTPPLLTAREITVLQLLAKGMTYNRIAAAMEVSHETVKMHLKHIYRKLKVHNKIEALCKVKWL